MTQPQPNKTIDSEALREQLEEFALNMKPGTTKGKHRTAIFDTLELTKLVQHLIAQEANKAYEKGYLKGQLAEMKVQRNLTADKEQA